MHTRHLVFLFLYTLTAGVPLSGDGDGAHTSYGRYAPHGPSAALDSLQFSRLGYAEGLVNSSVSSIVQDHSGFLWIGSQGGLHRYDGYDMRLYAGEPFDPHSLSHQLVQTLFMEQARDTLWIGTYGGLNSLETSSERMSHFRHRPHDPRSLSDDVVVAIQRDADDALWVGTLNGLNRLDDEETGTFTRFAPDDENRFSLPHHVIRCLYRDSRGRLWVGSYGGLSRVEVRNGKTHFVSLETADTANADPSTSNGLPSPFVMDIDEDANGDLWVGTWGGGLSRLDSDGTPVEHFRFHHNDVYQVLAATDGLIYVATWGGGLVVFNPQTGTHATYRHDPDDCCSISHDIVYSLFEDRTGIIWIGTNGNGVNKLDPERADFRFLHSRLPTNYRLPAGKVRTLYHDRQTGDLFIAIEGAGLSVRDSESGRVVNYRRDHGYSLSHNNVNAIMRDGDGSLLLGTHAGLDRFSPSEQRFESAWNSFEAAKAAPAIVYALLRDSHDSLWVGTYDAGLLRLMPDGSVDNYRHNADDPQSLSNNLVYDILEDRYGDIWVATNGGLNRFQPDTRSFQRYTYDADNPRGVSSNSTALLYEDTRGDLWIGSRAGGLMRYRRDDDTFSHITTAEGLSSNAVAAVLEAEPGILYVATSNGLNRVTVDPLDVTRVDERDGLHVREFAPGAAATSDGELLFSAFGEIIRVPEPPDPRTSVPPQVQLTAIQVMNRPYSAERAAHHIPALRLLHTENFLRFEFAAMDFSLPQRNRYRYRLIGIDVDWVEAGHRRTADYTSLPPGRYTFEVTAANSRGVWSEQPAQIAVTIQPPFWRTGWFLMLAVLALGLLAWLILRLRTRSLQSRAAQLEVLVELRTGEVSRANVELRRLNATKDRFFSIIAHDLRGPINGMSSLMNRVVHQFPDYNRESLHEISSVILDSARGLEAMLENLLEWARVQSGRITVDPQVMPVSDLVRSAFDAYRSAAHAKNITLELNCPGNAYIWADVHHARTVVENLVSNAVKFTHTGGSVTATVETDTTEIKRMGTGSRRQQEAPEPRTRLILSDTGVGISKTRLETLFSVEHASRSSGTAGERGSGLGLVLSHELVQRLGGTLEIQSTEGRGTTVILELPAASAATMPPQPRRD